jgi:hypothetical protein
MACQREPEFQPLWLFGGYLLTLVSLLVAVGSQDVHQNFRQGWPEAYLMCLAGSLLLTCSVAIRAQLQGALPSLMACCLWAAVVPILNEGNSHPPVFLVALCVAVYFAVFYSGGSRLTIGKLARFSAVCTLFLGTAQGLEHPIQPGLFWLLPPLLLLVTHGLRRIVRGFGQVWKPGFGLPGKAEHGWPPGKA